LVVIVDEEIDDPMSGKMEIYPGFGDKAKTVFIEFFSCKGRVAFDMKECIARPESYIGPYFMRKEDIFESGADGDELDMGIVKKFAPAILVGVAGISPDGQAVDKSVGELSFAFDPSMAKHLVDGMGNR
jgi:hypothetical protein